MKHFVSRMASKNEDNTPTTAVVGDLTSFTEEQIAKTLANVEVSFTCRFCQIQKTTLQDLIDHMVKGPCMKSGNHGDGDTLAAVQLKMAPHGCTTAATQQVVKPEVGAIHPVGIGKSDMQVPSGQSAPSGSLPNVEVVEVKQKAKRGRKRRPICPVEDVVETICLSTVPPRHHTTRCSTGAIKRININELLAAPIKWELEDEGEVKRKINHSEADLHLTPRQIKKEVCEVVPKRGRGRPRKYPKVEYFEAIAIKEERLCEAAEVEADQVTPVKRKVGRPRKDASMTSNEVCKIEDSPKSSSKALVPYQPLWLLSAITPETSQPKPSELTEPVPDSVKLDLVKSDPPEVQKVEVGPEGQSTSPVPVLAAEPKEKPESTPSPVTQPAEKPKRQNAGWKRPRTHRCLICKMRFFTTIGELDVHMDCHLEDVKKEGCAISVEKRDLYKCFECQYECAGWNRMLIHLVSHRGLRAKLRNTSIVKNIIGVFRCPVCKKAFEKKGNMKGHYRKVHFKHNRVCEVCGKTLAGVDEKTFVRHVEKCKNVQIQCEFCDYKTTVTANFRKHYKVHTGEGFTCEICLAVYPTRQRYDVHCRTHAIDRPKSVCEFCGQEFLSEDAVRKHVQRFHVERTVQYGCPQCQYIGKMEIDLRKHISSVHNKKFKCEQCQYQTNSPSAFEQHREYHQPDRIYGCPFTDQCFYRGATTKQLANHVSQVHKVGSKHQCPICLKFYKKKTHLLRHLVSHTKEKPYVCLECEMAFVNHSSYYRHRRKTGHDKKREGVVSVPQNITIQYLGEGVEVTTTSESPQCEFNSPTGDTPSEGHQVVLAQSHAAFMQDVANAEEVLRHEQGDNTEQVLLFDSTMFQLTPASMADLTNAITIEPLTEEVHTETVDGSTEELQCAGIQQQEVTYILKVGGDDSEYQMCTGAEETVSACEGDSEPLQEVIYKEANSCGVQTTIVEVAAPGGEDSNEHRYAILMCSPGDEPEAALSMLQLQSAVQ